MNLLKDLWNDDRGAILSAEVVTVGTIAVLGSITGLSMVNNAVDGELKDMAHALRSLDQSYAFNGHQSCGAYTAGSRFQQRDVQESLQALCADASTAEKAGETVPPSPVIVPVVPAPEAPANQLPEPMKKETKKKKEKAPRTEDDEAESPSTQTNGIARPPQARTE